MCGCGAAARADATHAAPKRATAIKDVLRRATVTEAQPCSSAADHSGAPQRYLGETCVTSISYCGLKTAFLRSVVATNPWPGWISGKNGPVSFILSWSCW